MDLPRLSDATTVRIFGITIGTACVLLLLWLWSAGATPSNVSGLSEQTADQIIGVSFLIGIILIGSAAEFFRKIGMKRWVKRVLILGVGLFFSIISTITAFLAEEGGITGETKFQILFSSLLFVSTVLLFFMVRKVTTSHENQGLEIKQAKYRLWLMFLLISIIALISTFVIGLTALREIRVATLSEATDIYNSDSTLRDSNVTSEANGHYENIKNGFSIDFPNSWNIGPGTNSKIVQRAIDGDRNISVFVVDLNSDTRSVKDLGAVESFATNFVDKLSDSSASSVYLVDFGETEISGESAYWLQHSEIPQGQNISFDNLLYSMIKDGKLYQISALAPSTEFETLVPVFEKTVYSFTFNF